MVFERRITRQATATIQFSVSLTEPMIQIAGLRTR